MGDRRIGPLDRTVEAEQCWGCNRVRSRDSLEDLILAAAEGRLRMGEYLCENDDCPANDIARNHRKDKTNE